MCWSRRAKIIILPHQIGTRRLDEDDSESTGFRFKIQCYFALQAQVLTGRCSQDFRNRHVLDVRDLIDLHKSITNSLLSIFTDGVEDWGTTLWCGGP